MAGQTIAERFCQTTNSTARHMLQDAAAMFGAQCVVSEQLEETLTRAEGGGSRSIAEAESSEITRQSLLQRPVHGCLSKHGTAWQCHVTSDLPRTAHVRFPCSKTFIPPN